MTTFYGNLDHLNIYLFVLPEGHINYTYRHYMNENFTLFRYGCDIWASSSNLLTHGMLKPLEIAVTFRLEKVHAEGGILKCPALLSSLTFYFPLDSFLWEVLQDTWFRSWTSYHVCFVFSELKHLNVWLTIMWEVYSIHAHLLSVCYLKGSVAHSVNPQAPANNTESQRDTKHWRWLK